MNSTQIHFIVAEIDNLILKAFLIKKICMDIIPSYFELVLML